MQQVWFPGIEERQRVYGLVCKLAAKKGDETIPNEDVIDLAQAIKYLMNDLYWKNSLT